MAEVVLLLVGLALSLLITRVATIALIVTGMSREAARFQTRSAMTGAGFTTTESESVLNHPVRRRIVMQLMLVGNAGLVLGAALLITSFAGADTDYRALSKGGVLLAGLFALVLLSRSTWVEKRLSRVLAWLANRVADVEVRDYARLLRLQGDYSVAELVVEEGDWIAGKTLIDVQLPDEGILVLGIVRNGGDYLGAPRGTTTLCPGDTLLLYGRAPAFSELDERRAGVEGDIAHHQAVAEQQRVVEREERQAAAEADAEVDADDAGGPAAA